MATYKLVMVRHGESEWIAENRFCGWHDSDLADSGISEAKKVGEVSIYLVKLKVNKVSNTYAHVNMDSRELHNIKQKQIEKQILNRKYIYCCFLKVEVNFEIYIADWKATTCI